MGQTVAPMMLSAIYSVTAPPSGSPTSDYQGAELACLVTCGTISFLACALYLPLPSLIPKQSKILPFDEEAPLDYYDQLTPSAWAALTIREKRHVNRKRADAGMSPILSHWLPYEDDRTGGNLDTLLERSGKEFQEIKDAIKGTLTNRAKLQDMSTKGMTVLRDTANKYDRKAAAQDMGTWIADYFDDAGYVAWLPYPDMYKAMVMNAFPPADALDGKKFDPKSAEELEAHLLKMLRVFDGHVRQQAVTASMIGARNFGDVHFRLG